MEKENHIHRPTDCVSRKETWAEDRRAWFEKELERLGWVKKTIRGEYFGGRQMPSEIRYCKDAPTLPALYIDDFGAFLYENGQRTHGISDDEIDKSPQGYLHFYDGPKLDLKNGIWV